MERIFISNKEIDKYLSACFFALSNGNDEVKISGRGNNTKRSIDVAAILLREHLDVPNELPTLSDVKKALDDNDTSKAKSLLNQLMSCEVKIGSENYENEDRFVSTIDITLRGKRKQ
jgi:DNA-binding protein